MKNLASKAFVIISVALMLVMILFGAFGVKASQILPPPIVGFSVNPIHPHYATIRKNGLLEITNYQTSANIGSYLIPLLYQDINNLDPTGFNVRDIVYSTEGDFIAVTTTDISSGGMFYLVDWQTGVIREELGPADLNRIIDMSWSPDGNNLVVASIDGGADQLAISDIAIININSGEIEQTLASMSRVDGQAWAVVAWSSGDIVAYANDTTLVFWDANANMSLESVITSSRTLNAVWSPNGQYIATLHTDRTLQIWDAYSDLSIPKQTTIILDEDFLSLDMQWLDNSLIAVNVWTDIQIWNTTTEDLEETIETEDYVRGLGASINNEVIFAGSQSVSTFPLTDIRTPTLTPVPPTATHTP